MSQKRIFTALLVLALAAVPVLADDVVRNGVDLWKTAEGGAMLDFAYEPIPAGFFCGGSEPFAGRVLFVGTPLATSPPGAFDNADTVIRRLDDARFNKRGVAVSRLRVEALSLAGLEPIHTSCGDFEIRASLAPVEQPMTEMRIVRTREGGGNFQAPLAFIVRLSFVPLEDGPTLEIDREVEFNAPRGARWNDRPATPVPYKSVGFVLLDTDGNQAPETFVPGPSNFFPAGQDPAFQKFLPCTPSTPVPKFSYCHDAGEPGKCHCTYP